MLLFFRVLLALTTRGACTSFSACGVHVVMVVVVGGGQRIKRLRGGEYKVTFSNSF